MVKSAFSQIWVWREDERNQPPSSPNDFKPKKIDHDKQEQKLNI